MKICLLTRYFNVRNAGIGKYSHKVLEYMLKKGHEVDPVCTSRMGAKGYLTYTAAEILTRIPRDVDVYHALTPMEAIYLPKSKSVATIHDLMPWLHPDSQAWYFTSHPFFRMSRLFAKYWFKFGCDQAVKCKILITNSNQTKQEVLTTFRIPSDKVRVQYLGIGSELGPKVVCRDPNRLVVGTLCYADKRKRVDLLVKAFLEADIPNSELHLYCFGPSETELRSLTNGDTRVRFLGRVEDSSKALALSSLDVFIFPSKEEGFGTPIVEAMACGTPVVTLSDAHIPPEVKGRTHIVPKEGLATLLKDRSWWCDTNRNLEFARGCSWERAMNETEKIYEEVSSSRT